MINRKAFVPKKYEMAHIIEKNIEHQRSQIRKNSYLMRDMDDDEAEEQLEFMYELRSGLI